MPKVRWLLDRLPGCLPLNPGAFAFLHWEIGITAAIVAGIHEEGDHGDSPA
ncbi:hypothetical protein [Sodalis sp. (in: enterobacteria)]|uniref:hypothetical protein n=1 Tax=Sodalis sp. (in: enterobacteria) TaxID=1898979 RepID=UPI003F683A5C